MWSLLLAACVGAPAADRDAGVPADGPSSPDATTCPAPATPSDPYPEDDAAYVAVDVTKLDWAYDPLATGYRVYFGACPVPDYPSAGFQSVTDSILTGLTLDEKTSYCWQVAAQGECGTALGPAWSFRTGCVPPHDPAVVTSPVAVTFPADQASGSYRLTFDQDVSGVADGLTWSATTGSGTLGPITQVDGNTYLVGFSGVADGDAYTLTVTSAVIDACGAPLAAPVDIQLTIGCWPGGSSCEDGDLCTTGEQCVAGACVGGPVDCSDELICTVDEQCDADTGQCQSNEVSPVGQPAPAFSLVDANPYSASHGAAVDPITDADGKVRVLALHGCT